MSEQLINSLNTKNENLMKMIALANSKIKVMDMYIGEIVKQNLNLRTDNMLGSERLTVISAQLKNSEDKNRELQDRVDGLISENIELVNKLSNSAPLENEDGDIEPLNSSESGEFSDAA